jgi:hypothetical protein
MAGPSAQSVLIVIWTLLAISAFFVGLRFYCKSFRGAKYSADDWVLLVAWVSLPSKPLLIITFTLLTLWIGLYRSQP